MFGSSFKGWGGEFLVKTLTKFTLDDDIYKPVHNVTIRTPDGTTQIDHIYVSMYGIFVIETKNLKGWIYGSPNHSTWTQVIYGNKYKFQNPLRQNYKHTEAVRRLLNLNKEDVISIVLMLGSCEIKTEMPENVLTSVHDLRNFLKKYQSFKFNTDEVDHAIRTIKIGKLSDFDNKKDHIKRLDLIKNSNSEQLCPKCGNKMVLRTAKMTGNKFLGCSKFPLCKFTRNI